MSHLKIVRRHGGGVLTAWVDETTDELYIRESLDRGKDVQTVCVSRAELAKISALQKEGELLEKITPRFLAMPSNKTVCARCGKKDWEHNPSDVCPSGVADFVSPQESQK